MSSVAPRVLFLREKTEKFKGCQKIKEECEKLEIELPDEVANYLYDKINPLMIECADLKEYQEDMRAGYDVDVSKIPPDTKTIRFYIDFDA